PEYANTTFVTLLAIVEFLISFVTQGRTDKTHMSQFSYQTKRTIIVAITPVVQLAATILFPAP
ncbi:MAG: hypothetical protein ACYTF1_23145, partial [Planctomycetota bacterium]